jgi:hypothetical protein
MRQSTTPKRGKKKSTLQRGFFYNPKNQRFIAGFDFCNETAAWVPQPNRAAVKVPLLQRL